jgi:anti-sigma B factor antagonist
MSELLEVGRPAAGPVMRRDRFNVHVDRHRVANVSGELDASTAPQLAVQLDRLADDGGIVCVDFSDLEFCGAAGINVLFGAVRRLGSRGRMVIYDPSPVVARMIEISGLDHVADVAVGRVLSASHASATNGAAPGSARRVVTAAAATSVH